MRGKSLSYSRDRQISAGEVSLAEEDKNPFQTTHNFIFPASVFDARIAVKILYTLLTVVHRLSLYY